MKPIQLTHCRYQSTVRFRVLASSSRFGQRKSAAGERQFGKICNAIAVCIMNSVSNTVVINLSGGGTQSSMQDV